MIAPTDEDTAIWMHLFRGKARTEHQREAAGQMYGYNMSLQDWAHWHDARRMRDAERAKQEHRARMAKLHGVPQ